MAEFNLQAGAGKAEIRCAPEDFPLKAFTGIHDAICVRVLLLGADSPTALVSIELTSLPPEAVQRFQQECGAAAGVREENVFISVTHTFSAPHIPPHIKSEQEQRLSDTMYDRISMAIRAASEEARASMAQAAVEYGEASCGLNVNRNVETKDGYWLGRNENGYSDHTVRVLKFRRGDRIFAYLVNYDIQASVMDKSEAADGGRLVSGDLAGAASRELEQGGAAALFLPGCAGDQAPMLQAVWTGADGAEHDLHEAGFVLAEQLGRYLAERVRGAKEGSSSFGAEDCLRVVSGTAELPEQEMKYATKELRPHKEYSFDRTGRSVSVPVTLICLGLVRLLLTAPELNSGFGTKLRQIMGNDLLIGTLVNGAVKYLPEAEDFERITYTAMNTKLGPGSAERFLETVSALKSELQK